MELHAIEDLGDRPNGYSSVFSNLLWKDSARKFAWAFCNWTEAGRAKEILALRPVRERSKKGAKIAAMAAN